MILILPGLNENFIINTLFINYYLTHLEHRKYPDENVNFFAYGNFPQVSWAREKNNLTNLVFYSNFTQIFQQYHNLQTGILLDCSSLLINKNNCYDILGISILKCANNFGDTGIIVSNNFSYDYFHELAPNCRMIASDSYNENSGERQFFMKISWPDQLNNFHKKAIYINNICLQCPLEKRLQCKNQEDLNISLFSKESIYSSCPNLLTDIHQKIETMNIFDEYYQEGKRTIIFPDYSFFPQIQLREYVKNLIKIENQQEVFNYLLLKWQGEK